MDSHMKTYELYCSVIGKNIIIEETTYHNGTKCARCLNKAICDKSGGCTNKILLDSILKPVEKVKK